MLDINLSDCTNILLAACRWASWASWVQLPGNLLHITQIRQFSSASTAPANPAIEILINSGPRTPAAVLVHGTLWSNGRPNGFVSLFSAVQRGASKPTVSSDAALVAAPPGRRRSRRTSIAASPFVPSCHRLVDEFDAGSFERMPDGQIVARR